MLQNFLIAAGPLVFPLLACSILGVSIVIERAFFWFSYRKNFDVKLVKLTYRLFSQKKITEALENIQDSKDPSLVCLRRCIDTHQAIKPLTLESLASQVLKPTRKFERALETIITIAPLLGILGTVLGIILSFQNTAPNGMANPAAMMSGLSQALITTAMGLGISIILLVCHNYFSKMSDSTREKLEEELSLFEELS